MTFGQIDPARLQGEALGRWYRRTAGEIEAERVPSARQAYNAFFSRPNGSTALSNLGDGVTAPAYNELKTAASSAHVDLDRAHRSRFDESFPPDAGAGDARVQVAMAAPAYWDHWSPRSCANCHGYTPDTLPPIGGQSPFPPHYSPRSGAPGRGGSQPDRGNKKECDLQYESDSQICGRLRVPSDVAVCRSTASERYAHCLKPNGTIGFPRLETNGRRRR
jgi:hypothetical protein